GIARDEAKALAGAAREIHKLDALFSPYVSPQVAERLRADPTLAELGGVERQGSVLLPHPPGLTAFSAPPRPWPSWAACSGRSPSSSPTSKASRRSPSPGRRPRSSRC